MRHAPAGDALLPLLAHRSPRVRFFAAEALGRLAYKPAVRPARRACSPTTTIATCCSAMPAASRCRESATPPRSARSRTHPSRGVRIAAIVALRRMRHADVARFLADADEGVVTEAARAINDDGSIAAALPALARLLDERRFTSEPLLRRAINANLRLGTSEALARLAAFAADRGRPEAMRVEAVSALGVWPAPSTLDRVDGMHLGPPAQAGRSGCRRRRGRAAAHGVGRNTESGARRRRRSRRPPGG